MHAERSNTWRMLLVTGAMVLAVGVLFAWSRLLFPVMAAFLLAYIAHPTANFFEKRNLSRTFGFLLILLLFIALLLVILLIFVPAIVHELIFLGDKLPSWRDVLDEQVSPLLADWERRYPEAYALLKVHITEWAQGNLPSMAQRLVTGVLGMLGSLFAFFSILLNLILIPVIAAYLTVDFHKFTRALRRLIPRPVLPLVSRVVREVDQVLRDFLRGQLLVAIALGVMYTAGLVLVRAPLALVIGPLAGLLSLIPYLGLVFGAGISVLLAALEYQDIWHPAGVIATFAIAQNVEGWFLTPRLLGTKVGLHPVWVLVALLLGGELFGLPGIVVGVPVAAALRVVLRHSFQAYRKSLFYLGAGLEIKFYTRQRCSICKEFELLLAPLLDCRGIHYRIIDVNDTPALKDEYGPRVPVLEVNGKVVAEGTVSPEELEHKLEGVLGGLP